MATNKTVRIATGTKPPQYRGVNIITSGSNLFSTWTQATADDRTFETVFDVGASTVPGLKTVIVPGYSRGGTPVPTVTSVTPSSGSTAGGTSATIAGTNLTGATAVKFGSTNAASYNVDSAIQITATSPAGSAGAVDVTVTTAGGTSATSGADQFTYTVPDSAAATNFIARTSGLDATHQNAYKALLNGLTTDGFFDGSGVSLILDALYIFATADTTTALLNLVNNATYNATATAPSFTVDQGYAGNGTSSFIDSNFNPPLADSPNFIRDSASLFVWSNTSASDPYGACGDALDHSCIYPRQVSSAFFNLNDSDYSSVANSNGSGLFTVVRDSSTTIKGYRNGGAAILSTASTSLALVGFDLKFLTSLGAFWSGVALAGGFGAKMSQAQNTNLYNRLHTYLQTIAGIS